MVAPHLLFMTCRAEILQEAKQKRHAQYCTSYRHIPYTQYTYSVCYFQPSSVFIYPFLDKIVCVEKLIEIAYPEEKPKTVGGLGIAHYRITVAELLLQLIHSCLLLNCTHSHEFITEYFNHIKKHMQSFYVAGPYRPMTPLERICFEKTVQDSKCGFMVTVEYDSRYMQFREGHRAVSDNELDYFADVPEPPKLFEDLDDELEAWVEKSAADLAKYFE